MWNPFEQPELVPIPREPTEAKSESVSININLPIPESTGVQLGIYLKRLETWCKIAGISHLIIGISSETNDDTPGVGSVDAQGQAVAGLTLSSSKQFSDNSQRHRALYGFFQNFKIHRTALVEIKLRLQEILKEVSAKSEKGLRDPRAVAEKIDIEIKKALFKESLKFLLTNFEHGDLIVLMTRILSIIQFGLAGELIRMIPFYNLLGLITVVIYRLKGSKMPFRPSLVAPSGPEIDRALILAICLLTQTLIEPIIEEATEPEEK